MNLRHRRLFSNIDRTRKSGGNRAYVQHQYVKFYCLFYRTSRLMQACVDVAFPYAHLREAFGKKIGEHQVTSSLFVFLCLSVVSLGYPAV